MHAEFLDQLHEEYGDRVDFLTVYVRRPLPPGGSAKPGPRWLGEVDLGRWPLLGRYIAEAHASDEWSLLDSTNGVHEGKFDVQAAQSMEQRLATAREWVEWLSPKQEYAFSSVQVWAASRPISPHSKAVATMNWFVENTTHAAKHEFLRTSCTQPASDVRPGAPGLSVGIRDFSKDFVTPPAPRTFDPPAGVVCTGGGGGGGGFEPSTGCKPACATGALCCKSATGPPPGACFKVTNCSQVHGDGFALDARANGLANHGLDRFGF